MSNACVQVVRPGNITLQDLGRTRLQHIGYSQGGAADEHAFLWANKLLNNSANTPVLESMFIGCELEFSHPTQIAVTGAAHEILIEGNRYPSWQTFTIEANTTVTLPTSISGVYTYISVKGGFTEKSSDTGFSTVVREKTGFNQGVPFKEGQGISYNNQTLNYPSQKMVPHQFIPDYLQPLTLRLIPGFQINRFSNKDISGLLANDFVISPDSNKMGYRLTGGKLKHMQTIQSEGVPFGSVQLPPSGELIVLLKDRQTIGGYPKLGCIVQQDCFKLSQRRPGASVNFESVYLDSAVENLKEFYSFFNSNT